MTMLETTAVLEAPKLGQVQVRFPRAQPGGLDQDQEWCIVEFNGTRKRIRFHDYDEVFAIPGLYEHLFYRRLKCNSPEVVCSLLERQVRENSTRMSELAALDIGAGNGMVGEELAARGVESVVGVDIIEEAAEATQRDRPGVYEKYFVADLTDLPVNVADQLEETELNCLTVVAALGYGDIPPAAFARAYNLISTPGWVAFNIKEGFLADGDSTGFAGFTRRMIRSGIMHVRVMHRYRHRLSIAGDPLHYMAVVATKESNIPETWLAELD